MSEWTLADMTDVMKMKMMKMMKIKLMKMKMKMKMKIDEDHEDDEDDEDLPRFLLNLDALHIFQVTLMI